MGRTWSRGGRNEYPIPIPQRIVGISRLFDRLLPPDRDLATKAASPCARPKVGYIVHRPDPARLGRANRRFPNFLRLGLARPLRRVPDVVHQAVQHQAARHLLVPQHHVVHRQTSRLGAGEQAPFTLIALRFVRSTIVVVVVDLHRFSPLPRFVVLRISRERSVIRPTLFQISCLVLAVIVRNAIRILGFEEESGHGRVEGGVQAKSRVLVATGGGPWQRGALFPLALLLHLPVAPPPTKYIPRRHFGRDLVAALPSATFLRRQVCKAQFAQLLGDLPRLELEGRREAVALRNKSVVILDYPRRTILEGRIDDGGGVVVVVVVGGGRDDPLLHQAQFLPFPFRMLQTGRWQIETAVQTHARPAT